MKDQLSEYWTRLEAERHAREAEQRRYERSLRRGAWAIRLGMLSLCGIFVLAFVG